MAGSKERISATVPQDMKTDFQIAAMRRDMKEAELLRNLVQDFLADEDIPQGVREYFKERQEGNPKTATAD